jgi:predicted phage terminase large subunit-like protein
MGQDYDRHDIRRHGPGAVGYLLGQVAPDLVEELLGPEGNVWQKASEHLLNFTTFTFPTYTVDKFHDHVATELTKVCGLTIDGVDYSQDRSYDRVMLFAPPQHGKSELTSTRLPAFWLGNNPHLPVGLVSYAATLAERNSRNARAILRDPKFSRVFPETGPDLQNWRVHEWHTSQLTTGQPAGGYALAVGVGGAITGHGFGLIIIDDPIESWAHAQSETIRENTWQWWLGTLKTRIWEHGRIVLMMTRWHKDDLAGRILEEEGRIEEGGLWRVLSYPALAMAPTTPEDLERGHEYVAPDLLGREVGEPLAPSRFSKEWLEDQRDSLGTSKMVWNAEYQQMPTDPEGDFFKVGRIQIEDTPPKDICEIMDGQPVGIQKGIRYWDLAATKKSKESRDPDFVSGTLMAEGERRFWVLDQQRGQLDPEQVFDLVKLTAKLDGKKVKIRIEQEPGAAGKSLVQAYIHALAGYDVEGIPASGDKTVRAQAYASQVNAGNVALLKGDWNKPYIAELAGFPNMRHDDQVDSSSGAFNEITSEEQRWKEVKFLSV